MFPGGAGHIPGEGFSGGQSDRRRDPGPAREIPTTPGPGGLPDGAVESGDGIVALRRQLGNLRRLQQAVADFQICGGTERGFSLVELKK